MKNLHLKIFALCAAILLFRFVTSEGNSSVMGFFVPVEVKNIPHDKVLLWPLSPQAQVSIKGPSFLVSSVVASPPTFKVRIPADVQNRYVATLSKSDLALPPNVQVLSIDPGEIQMSFDNLVQRELPVEFATIGALHAGLTMEKLQVTPDRVLIRGPESRLRELKEIQTEPVDLRDVDQAFAKDVPLRLPGSLTELSVQQAHVTFSVSEILESKIFPAVPVELRSTSGEKLLLPVSKVSIEVRGPVARISTLKPEEIIPYVRVQRDTRIPGALEVACDLPKGLSVVKIDPMNLEVVRSLSGQSAKKSQNSKK